MSATVGIGRIRHALGDGATEQQARRVHALLRDAGLLDGSGGVPALIGIAEIAAQAGVTPSAVCQWRDLPDPLAVLKQGRIWAAPDIEKYLQARAARRPVACDHDAWRRDRDGDMVCLVCRAVRK